VEVSPAGPLSEVRGRRCTVGFLLTLRELSKIPAKEKFYIETGTLSIGGEIFIRFDLTPFRRKKRGGGRLLSSVPPRHMTGFE
jgi:hypothetical protein